MSYWSQTHVDDEYDTPKELWENIVDYLPTNGESLVWEPFYSNGESGNILSDLGCNVVQGKSDFFNVSKALIEKIDLIVTNVPFSIKKEILQKLKEIDKPFILIMPASTIFTQYFSETFGNTIQVIVPKKRMHFKKNGKLLKRTSFDSCYFCYKLDLKRDMIWL